MKIIITIIITTLVILFGAQNFDHTAIFLFTGTAIRIRVVFLIAISGIAGYLIRYLTSIHHEEQLKKAHRHLLIRFNNMAKSRGKSGHKYPNEDEL